MSNDKMLCSWIINSALEFAPVKHQAEVECAVKMRLRGDMECLTFVTRMSMVNPIIADKVHDGMSTFVDQDLEVYKLTHRLDLDTAFMIASVQKMEYDVDFVRDMWDSCGPSPQGPAVDPAVLQNVRSLERAKRQSSLQEFLQCLIQFNNKMISTYMEVKVEPAENENTEAIPEPVNVGKRKQVEASVTLEKRKKVEVELENRVNSPVKLEKKTRPDAVETSEPGRKKRQRAIETPVEPETAEVSIEMSMETEQKKKRRVGAEIVETPKEDPVEPERKKKPARVVAGTSDVKVNERRKATTPASSTRSKLPNTKKKRSRSTF